MHDLDALRLLIEWGADEALSDTPLDRFAMPTRTPAVAAPHLASPAPVRKGNPDTAPGRAALSPLRRAPARAPSGPAPSPADGADIDALFAMLDGLDTPLRATASHTVRPGGALDSGLMFVAEAPGPDEDRAGVALAGPAGERIRRILATAGLGADRFAYAHLLPWRPPGGRPASTTELELCLPFLHRLLALARPRCLVLLGTSPARTLGGLDGSIRRLRGKWAEPAFPGVGPLPCLPMLKPEEWLASPASKRDTWADLLTLQTRLNKS